MRMYGVVVTANVGSRSGRIASAGSTARPTSTHGFRNRERRPVALTDRTAPYTITGTTSVSTPMPSSTPAPGIVKIGHRRRAGTRRTVAAPSTTIEVGECDAHPEATTRATITAVNTPTPSRARTEVRATRRRAGARGRRRRATGDGAGGR